MQDQRRCGCGPARTDLRSAGLPQFDLHLTREGGGEWAELQTRQPASTQLEVSMGDALQRLGEKEGMNRRAKGQRALEAHS